MSDILWGIEKPSKGRNPWRAYRIDPAITGDAWTGIGLVSTVAWYGVIVSALLE